MTPEEAKTKECVFKYMSVVFPSTIVALTTGKEVDGDVIKEGVSCGAGECALWTWFDDEKTEGRCGLI